MCFLFLFIFLRVKGSQVHSGFHIIGSNFIHFILFLLSKCLFFVLSVFASVRCNVSHNPQQQSISYVYQISKEYCCALKFLLDVTEITTITSQEHFQQQHVTM